MQHPRLAAPAPTAKLLISGGVLLGGYAALATGMWAFQRQLIYRPGKPTLTSAHMGPAGAEPVALPTEDGLSLAGWLISAGEPPPVGAVIIFHGNAGNRADRLPLAAALAAAGLDVLLFDYRGYGGNSGAPSERGLLADAQAARAWLAERCDAGPDRMVYIGESLGCGVAAALALEEPPRAMILRSPFVSLAKAARRQYPFLPMQALLRDRFPVAEQVGRYHGPLLVIAGEADKVVPPAQSRQVAAVAGGSARFVLIPGAGHQDRAMLDGDGFLDAVVTFLHEVEAAR